MANQSSHGTDLTVDVLIDADPATVWAAVEDVGAHTEWMEDAVAIRFTSEQTSGVGTAFDCDTKVGPIRLVDHMEITVWEPGAAMGVRHVGMVTGSGVFRLAAEGNRPDGTARTRFTWTETLTFPWWMGGKVGGFFARPVLGQIWKKNLTNLKGIVERGDAAS